MSSAALKKCQEINVQLTEENAYLTEENTQLKAEIEQLTSNNVTTILQRLNQTNNTLTRNLNPLSNDNQADLERQLAELEGGYRRRARKHRTNKYRSKKRKGTKRR